MLSLRNQSLLPPHATAERSFQMESNSSNILMTNPLMNSHSPYFFDSCSPSSIKVCKDQDIAKMNKYDFRSKCVGVVFQNFNLLSKLTAVENVVLSMEISGMKEKDKKQKAYELLEKVGLDKDEADRRILKLSGGQQQRVAIARALSYDPDIILADEPTGNLDGETQNEIMDIFKSLAEAGKCVIIVTHSPEVAEMADLVYEIKKK